MSESEYRIMPGHIGWLSYEQLTGVLAAWNDLPLGAPAITISKRPVKEGCNCHPVRSGGEYMHAGGCPLGNGEPLCPCGYHD